MFGSSGYNGGSLRQIAERVGVSPGTINRHFSSKEDLLRAVLDRWEAEVSERLEGRGLGGLSELHKLREGMQYHEEHPHLLGLFLLTVTESGAAEHPARSFMHSRYSDLLEHYRRNLRLAVENGEVEPMDDRSIDFEARSLIAFMDGIEIQYLLEPDFSLVEAFDEYWERSLRRWGARTSS